MSERISRFDLRHHPYIWAIRSETHPSATTTKAGQTVMDVQSGFNGSYLWAMERLLTWPFVASANPWRTLTCNPKSKKKSRSPPKADNYVTLSKPALTGLMTHSQDRKNRKSPPCQRAWFRALPPSSRDTYRISVLRFGRPKASSSSVKRTTTPRPPSLSLSLQDGLSLVNLPLRSALINNLASDPDVSSHFMTFVYLCDGTNTFSVSVSRVDHAWGGQGN